MIRINSHSSVHPRRRRRAAAAPPPAVAYAALPSAWPASTSDCRPATWRRGRPWRPRRAFLGRMARATMLDERGERRRHLAGRRLRPSACRAWPPGPRALPSNGKTMSTLRSIDCSKSLRLISSAPPDGTRLATTMTLVCGALDLSQARMRIVSRVAASVSSATTTATCDVVDQVRILDQHVARQVEHRASRTRCAFLPGAGRRRCRRSSAAG